MKDNKKVKERVTLQLRVVTRDVDSIKFIKSLLPSLFQREDLCPSLAKRGWGDFNKFKLSLFTEGLQERAYFKLLCY
jgi:hypothetical protein